MDESSAYPTTPADSVEADATSPSSVSETPLASEVGKASAAARETDEHERDGGGRGKESDETNERGPGYPPLSTSAAAPVHFGKFELLEELSRTPNSVVYRAVQTDLHGRDVALKVLVEGPQGGEGEENDDRVTRFRREVENVARLRHPNIVGVYEVGEIDGFTYFSMEYVDGCSLAQWIEEHGPMSGRDAAELSYKIARAIHYAHTRGIIHRDIKPANILLDRVNGEPMIADFGLAKDIRSDVRITQSGVTVGTPPYMPPEQARGQHDMLDSRSDVYALGATLYEAVTGRPPFDGDTGIQVMMRVLEKAPTRPRRLASSLSPDLEAIILRCLAKRQRERYENAELYAQDLARYLRGEWVQARKATLVHRVGRFLKAYRDLAYVLLAITIVYAIHLAGQYVAGTASQGEQRVPILPDGAEATSWRLEALRGNVEAFYPMELWLNDPSREGTEADATGEAVAISVEPLGLRDFELRFQADILGGATSAAQEPGLGVFLVPDREAAQVPPGSWPPIREGYLFLLGARQNTRAAVYRVERNARAPDGPGRAVALLAEPRLRLAEQGGKYDVAISLVSSQLSFDVRDVSQRRRWRLEAEDDFVLPLPATSLVGFYCTGTSAVIERWSLAARSWHLGSRWLDRGDGKFLIGAYAEALSDYEAALLFAQEDPVLRNQLAERIALTREALAESPLMVAPEYESLHAARHSLRVSRRLIECYVQAGLARQAQAVLEDVLARDEDDLEAFGDATLRWLVPAGRRWADELAVQARASWPWEGKLPRQELDAAALAGDESADNDGDLHAPRALSEIARHHYTESPSPLERADAARDIYREMRRLLRERPAGGEYGSVPVDFVEYVELLLREGELTAWQIRTTGERNLAQHLRRELVATSLHEWLHTSMQREPPRKMLSLLRELRGVHLDMDLASAYLALLTRTRSDSRGADAGREPTHLLDELAASRVPPQELRQFAEELRDYLREHDLRGDPSAARIQRWYEGMLNRQRTTR